MAERDFSTVVQREEFAGDGRQHTSIKHMTCISGALAEDGADKQRRHIKHSQSHRNHGKGEYRSDRVHGGDLPPDCLPTAGLYPKTAVPGQPFDPPGLGPFAAS